MNLSNHFSIVAPFPYDPYVCINMYAPARPPASPSPSKPYVSPCRIRFAISLLCSVLWLYTTTDGKLIPFRRSPLFRGVDDGFEQKTLCCCKWGALWPLYRRPKGWTKQTKPRNKHSRTWNRERERAYSYTDTCGWAASGNAYFVCAWIRIWRWCVYITISWTDSCVSFLLAAHSSTYLAIFRGPPKNCFELDDGLRRPREKESKG